MAFPRAGTLRHVCRAPILVTSPAPRPSPAPTARLTAGRRCYGKKYSKTYSKSLGGLLHVSPEVRDALNSKKPVVALETTIYTHGALRQDLPELLESIVRQNGAVPATIGVLDGVPRVGLSPEEVARMVEEGARKISRRDFAYIVGAVRLHPPTAHSRRRPLMFRLGLKRP